MKKDHGFFHSVFKLRGGLMLPPVLVTLFSHHGEIEDHWVFFAGGLVFATGAALRIWTQTHLHYRLSEPTRLTYTGPYAFVRNPIYIANTLMLVGMCFLSELLWFIPFMLFWCGLVYSLTVMHEERHLDGKYDDAYMRFYTNVPRWLPRTRAWKPQAIPAPKQSFLWPSLLTEAHCVLLVIPYVFKEYGHF